MRLTIVAVGRLKDGAERVLVDRYAARLASAKTLGLGPFREVEITEARQSSAEARRADEGKRLLTEAAGADLVVMLDEGGRAMPSQAFATWIGQARDDGRRHMAFLIGGPDGHGPAVGGSAGLKLSLGPMTLPHGLARAVLIEQLYRAVTILSGHPYHRS